MTLRKIFWFGLILFLLIVNVGMIVSFTPVVDNIQYSGTLHSVDSTGDGYPDRITEESPVLEKNKYNVIIEVSHIENAQSKEQLYEQLQSIEYFFESRQLSTQIPAESINIIFIDAGTFSNNEYEKNISSLSLEEYEETVSNKKQYDETCDSYHLVITEEIDHQKVNNDRLNGIEKGSVMMVVSDPYNASENNIPEQKKSKLFKRTIAHETGHLLGLSSRKNSNVDTYQNWRKYPSVMNYNFPCSIYSNESCQQLLTFTENDWKIMETELNNREHDGSNCNIQETDVI